MGGPSFALRATAGKQESMSMRVQFGPEKKELRVGEGDPLVRSDGAVLGGVLSVEEAQLEAARKARRAEAGKPASYGNVGECDPVLRSHCRLDREG